MNEAISLVRAFYASRRTTLSPTDLRSIGPICSQYRPAFETKQQTDACHSRSRTRGVQPEAGAPPLGPTLEAVARPPLCARKSKQCSVIAATLRTNAAKPDQALKALAHCLTAAQPVPESVQNDIVKVVQSAKSANNGAALDDADVIMLLTWALRYIDHSELFPTPLRPNGHSRI